MWGLLLSSRRESWSLWRRQGRLIIIDHFHPLYITVWCWYNFYNQYEGVITKTSQQNNSHSSSKQSFIFWQYQAKNAKHKSAKSTHELVGNDEIVLKMWVDGMQAFFNQSTIHIPIWQNGMQTCLSCDSAILAWKIVFMLFQVARVPFPLSSSSEWSRGQDSRPTSKSKRDLESL